MTKRERNLAMLFGVGLVGLFFLLGVKKYRTYRTELSDKIEEARGKLETYDAILASKDNFSEEERFFSRYEPTEPKRPQAVQNELVKFKEEKVRQYRLEETKSPSIQPEVKGPNFSRTRVVYYLRGKEADILGFLTQVSVPVQFRVATILSLKPAAGDNTNTLVDAEIGVDQWFVSSAVGEEAPVAPPAEPAPDADSEKLVPELPIDLTSTDKDEDEPSGGATLPIAEEENQASAPEVPGLPPGINPADLN